MHDNGCARDAYTCMRERTHTGVRACADMTHTRVHDAYPYMAWHDMTRHRYNVYVSLLFIVQGQFGPSSSLVPFMVEV